VNYTIEIEDIDYPQTDSDGVVVEFAIVDEEGGYVGMFSKIFYMEDDEDVYDKEEELKKEVIKIIKKIAKGL
jgi:hypothetical protein